VQHHLGDETWALPYWDYTKPEDEEAHKLPEPFRDARAENPLYTRERNSRINAGDPLRDGRWDARPALRIPRFSLPMFDTRPSFGAGMMEDVTPLGRTRGSLEGTPHGTVHSAVGGWMGFFDTAALDPIFWLHHANVDRLWEVWLGLGNADPEDETWLLTGFEFYDVDGERKTLTIESMRDTRALGYAYEATAPPSGLVGPPPERARRGAVARGGDIFTEEEALMPSPELVGAARNVPFAEATTVTVDLASPRRPRFAPEGLDEGLEEDERWYLRVENIVESGRRHPRTAST
jgi:tyrosinase